ncbi:dihydrofolate reductase family protein [Cyanobium sp. WAJ14-Wanaka]|uniref:RibD family protein n=1 Tax=Cyanobium sp. WAJ14-Wanaka TaxID=2823725 RepID=UPI0020CC028E|nr:dihydrofolate reductase family protein [Cyanobium sp. WAJ14-Wanaka]MCP9775290.1 dihydrofolate reductase family protein [Cyanobium sp. WAJ14-Wanaka]
MNRPELRLVLATSLDGRLAPPEGGAAHLGGQGDRRALEEALAWADGCLIGAETLRRHGSTCLIRAADLLAQRLAAGRSPQPAALVLSRTGQLPAELPFFQQPLERWLLVPPGLEIPANGQFQRHWPLGPWPDLWAGCWQAGLERLVVLGGAQVASQLLAGHWIDELQLTLCPSLLGGPHGWIPWHGGEAFGGSSWRLVEHRPLGGEELLLRYRRA